MNSIIVFVAFIGYAAAMATPQNPPFLGPLLSATPLVSPAPGPAVNSGPAVNAVPVSRALYYGSPVPYVSRNGYITNENFQTPTLAKSEIRDDAGQYSLSYVTANGIRVNERTFLKLGPEGDYIPVKEGTYQYISPEGIPVSYGYKADENGFVVKGYPLPVAPQ